MWGLTIPPPPHGQFYKFMFFDTLEHQLKLISPFFGFLNILHCYVFWGRTVQCVCVGGGATIRNEKLFLNKGSVNPQKIKIVPFFQSHLEI